MLNGQIDGNAMICTLVCRTFWY